MKLGTETGLGDTTMKVQTSGMGSGITVQFTIGDMTQSDQIELFIMSFRNLGLDRKLSSSTLAEIDAALSDAVA